MAANIDPNGVYVILGSELEKLTKPPEGTKGQINVRVVNGQVSISFAQTERFRCVRNGVIMTFEIPAQVTDN